MKHILLQTATLAGLFAISAAAQAATAPNIPEPGVLSLLVAGGIVGAIVAVRRRRK